MVAWGGIIQHNVVRGGGFNFICSCGEDAKGCEVHSSGCEDNNNCPSLGKSRLDSSYLVGDIHNKGALANEFLPFNTIIDAILSSMGFRVG